MKAVDLTLFQWQSYLEQFRRENWDAKPSAAFRIDGTIFSTARHYGGFTYNGDTYTVFYFPEAMIGVREDFLKWLTAKLKAENGGEE